MSDMYHYGMTHKKLQQKITRLERKYDDQIKILFTILEKIAISSQQNEQRMVRKKSIGFIVSGD